MRGQHAATEALGADREDGFAMSGLARECADIDDGRSRAIAAGTSTPVARLDKRGATLQRSGAGSR